MHQDKNEIMQLLKSEDQSEQREGAFLARDMKLVEAVPYLVGLLQSRSIGVQEAADMALRKIGGGPSVSALIPLLASDSPPVRNLSMDILRHIGHQDIDALLRLLKSEDTDLRIFSADILGSTRSYLAVAPLCELLLKDPEVNVRYQAAVSLGDLGRSGATECLKRAFSDEEWVQYAVVEALSKLRDESSVKVLIQALGNSSELVCSMIVDALGEMGDIKSVPMLLKRIEDSPATLRNKIVKAVINILGGKALTFLSNKEKEKLHDYLLAALKDDETDIQDAAILGLGYVGGARASRSILNTAALMDPDYEEDRLQKVHESLVSIGYNQSLVEGLISEDETLASLAIHALGSIGGKEAINDLISSFALKNRDQQREIAHMLHDCAGREARDFFLTTLQQHQDGDVLKYGISFIGVKLRDEESIPVLLRFLEHPWDDVKKTALEAVLSTGGGTVLRHFQDMLSSTDTIKRVMAVYAIGRLGADNSMETLAEALNDEAYEVRKIALEAMGHISPEDKNVLHLVVKGLQDENREVRRSVVDLLDECPYPESHSYLLKALHDPDEWVRVRVVEALGRKKIQDNIPEMLSLWERSSQLVKIKIVEALGIIGGQTAFRSLLDILDDPDQEIQDAAETALDKLQEQNMEQGQE
ncbi:HEAT repeat domain-containing protein [Desulfonatronospira sp.]|uniref:HEAT repeat domain-containing protein n=1 Tax=Desulfonatronospira sp. TaxID=1962951 RepID=UPI0025B82DA8|nr:HEAT repeat domain-containing protein [Desulfonatronospira sp.]